MGARGSEPAFRLISVSTNTGVQLEKTFFSHPALSEPCRAKRGRPRTGPEAQRHGYFEWKTAVRSLFGWMLRLLAWQRSGSHGQPPSLTGQLAGHLYGAIAEERAWVIDMCGTCPATGKPFLRTIVDWDPPGPTRRSDDVQIRWLTDRFCPSCIHLQHDRHALSDPAHLLAMATAVEATIRKPTRRSCARSELANFVASATEAALSALNSEPETIVILDDLKRAGTTDLEIAAPTLSTQAYTLYRKGHHSRAVRLNKAAARIYQHLGQHTHETTCLVNAIADARHLNLGRRLEELFSLTAQALHRLRYSDLTLIARMAKQLGMICSHNGLADAGRYWFAEADSLFEAQRQRSGHTSSDDTATVDMLLTKRMIVHQQDYNELDEARAKLEDNAAACRALGSIQGVANAYNSIVCLLCLHGRPSAALTILREQETLFEQGTMQTQAMTQAARGVLECKLGDRHDGRLACESAIHLFRRYQLLIPNDELMNPKGLLQVEHSLGADHPLVHQLGTIPRYEPSFDLSKINTLMRPLCDVAREYN